MDKKQLQHTILEAAYNREVWIEVLKEYFGVRKIHIKPQQINIDNSKAEYAFELGSFTTIDEKLVGIFEVKLLPQVWIERNRVGLRSLLRQVYKYDVDGALIVFVQDDKWRFSYVSEIRTEEGKKETEPKRYTYLFGKNESSRTAADRFDKLKGKPTYLNDLFEAFSVEKLNKDFFKTYKEFYEKFWKYLAGEKKYYKLLIDTRQSEEEKKQKPIRDFSKKLLGRIVFLQFLQKKGWMGVPVENLNWDGGNVKFLQSLFKNHNTKNKFHSTTLKTLFFETLNTKRVNDLAPASLGSGIKIPYLNGGLFDKDISYQYDFDFPVDLFENLFDFFEQYNFTIDENDPYDNQVGIDPEMLGHIFENLLEENREKGAFYTPKEIVHYMCQESLIEYLHTQFTDVAKEDFNLLVRSNQVSQNLTTHKKAIEINNKLKEVKICDPAIGSGAFPMGLLKEIFECRRLIYPYIKTNEAFNPAIVKKEIIQQNIYGVDIENGAVEIARLRFWLALVVDEIEPQPLPNLDYKIMQGNSLLESFEGVDLSNLADMEKEQTFISASVAQFELGSELSLVKETMLVFDEKSKQQLYVLINDYYSYDETTNTKYPNKQFIKDEINKIVEGKLIAKFFLEKPKTEKIISDLKKTIASNTIKKSDTPALIKKKEKNIEKLNRELLNQQLVLEKLNFVIKQLHDLQTRTDKPYFLWHLWFKDVFDKGGFDVIIGNPPYRQLQKMGKEADDLQNARYETFIRTGDIYCLFYEQGNNLLRQNGNLCFITSNKWMNAAYGLNFRKYLLQETNPTLLIDFSKAVIFPAAVVFVNILQFKKEKNKNVLLGIKAQSDFQIGKSPLHEYILQNAVILSDLNEDNWAVAEKQDFVITKRIDEVGTPLKNWDLKFFRGITSGLNEAFHIGEKERIDLINADKKNDKIIKSLLRGKDIKRYSYIYDNCYILFIPWHFPLNVDEVSNASEVAEKEFKKQYPDIYKHLSKFKGELSARNVSETGIRYEWYALQRYGSNFWKEFEKDKIVWIEISDRANYCLDTEGHFLTNSAYFITGENLKYLLAVLNSRLMDFYFYQKTAQIAGGRKRYTKQ
ncbi:MAG: Eco57I restriction-modification methylase domain-containing protein [Ignavibacteriales bacterium]|nr:Eco57I restriction-modification methylase domain-containing protein [Ignavibacteriales bacterium]